MTTSAFKQSVNFLMPALVAIAITVSLTASFFISTQPTEARGLIKVADCRMDNKPSNSSNAAYVSCVNVNSYEAMIYRAYNGVLGRDPEKNSRDALAAWLPIIQRSTHKAHSGVTAVTATMMSSPEYNTKAWAQYDNTRWVSSLYQRSLSRPAGPSESNYWTGLMTRDTRGGDRRWSRPQVAAHVVQSREARASQTISRRAVCYAALDACTTPRQ